MRLWLRRFLGVEDLAVRITGLSHSTHFLGVRMATATEQLTAFSAKFDDFAGDVRAALAVINEDKLSPPAQEALDGLNAKLDALDTEVGDADASDTPAEPTDEDTAQL